MIAWVTLAVFFGTCLIMVLIASKWPVDKDDP